VQQEVSGNPDAVDGPARLVVVELNGRQYGLPIERVVEMLRMVAITPLPHSPEWVAGVINMRGQIVTVIDLRSRFGIEQQPYGLDTPLCVVEVFDRFVALVADAAVDVVEVSADALEVPDEIAGAHHPVSALARVGARLIPVLVLERVCEGTQTLELPDVDYHAA